MLKLSLRGFNLSFFCRRELLAAQQQLAATDLACTIKLEYDSKPGDAGWFGFGLEEENALIQGVLILLRFVAGGACAVAAINGVGAG
jgi:hypothetical protein